MRMIANARMYAVTPEVEAAWRDILGYIAREAGVELHYEAYPAPQPLETLWARPDLGCVLMCGYPIAMGLADIVPIAAPIPRADWALRRPLYRSDLIVRKDSPFRTLEDSFGARAGWTVSHSHSGFNAFRHHLLPFRNKRGDSLYSAVASNLITARKVLDSVLDGSIDIGPLDSYWHLLIDRHAPELTAGIRILDVTALAPVPSFVASRAMPAEIVAALKAAFVDAAGKSWFAPFQDKLMLDGFASVELKDFAVTLKRDREAVEAGYLEPA